MSGTSLSETSCVATVRPIVNHKLTLGKKEQTATEVGLGCIVGTQTNPVLPIDFEDSGFERIS